MSAQNKTVRSWILPRTYTVGSQLPVSRAPLTSNEPYDMMMHGDPATLVLSDSEDDSRNAEDVTELSRSPKQVEIHIYRLIQFTGRLPNGPIHSPWPHEESAGG